jgi:hypothetical protein
LLEFFDELFLADRRGRSRFAIKPFDDVRMRRALTLALHRWGSGDPGKTRLTTVCIRLILERRGETKRHHEAQSAAPSKPTPERFVADSPLEGDGFELLVPRHESPRFPKHPGMIVAPIV